MNTNWEKANEGEDLAAGFLLKKGFTILERNYHFGHGELDMIARDGETLVFVEVKTRKSASYGPAEYSITYGKQKQLYHIAQGYMFERKIENVPCRFDVVIVEFERGRPVFKHYENAFQL
jgi:putative endonuclease